MSDFIHHTVCPVCGSASFTNNFSVKDFTVSQELFPIVECNSCSLRFTQDIPTPENSSRYYQSENYISHTNTSKGLINRIYLRVRNRTMIKKMKLIKKISGLKNGSLLDVGSGTGTFVNFMKENGWNVKGVEPDANAREVARQTYHVELSDEKQLKEFSSASFDVITLWHVLEHVYDLDNYLQQLKLLLKEDGKIFIAVPNYTSYDAHVYKKFWAAYDVPRHLYHFSPKSMKYLLEKNDLKLLHHKPMWYDSFYISLLSSKYKNQRTRWLAALWKGFFSNLVAFFDVKRCSSLIYVAGK